MLPKKWGNLERQRPRLRWATYGMGIGAALTVLGALGLGSWVFGLLVLVGSGIWAYSLLK
ncbi:MAG: hypothetical protein OWU33_05445 [Firmicutes bacterium]|jgi:hypothetical protein|nr:hypothetical protein [Bacillota bacterium]